MHITKLAITVAAAAFLMGGAAFAQSTAPAPAPAAPAQAAAPAKPTATPVVRTAKSIECSKEADAKGLHGKERKKFEKECKKAK